MDFILKVKDFFFKGDKRSIRAKQNIALSVILKGISIGISILLVPLTLNYLNQTDYGIWLTLSSVIGWINFFDIGLGNGLRNKLAEALAKGNKELGRIYVSTTFALLVLIIFVFFVLFVIINPFINWTRLFHTNSVISSDLNLTVLFVFVFFCLQFLFKIVNIVLMSDQKPAYSDLINVSGNLLSLAGIFILVKTTSGSLLLAGIVLSSVPVLVLVVAHFLIFKTQYKFLTPSWHHIDLKYTHDLMGLGIQFFIIQISCLIVFTTSNIVISHLFGPAEVTPYNIAFKYYSVVTMVFNIIVSPFWSAYTEAYFRKEYTWIKNVTKKLVFIWGFFVVITLIMTFFSGFIYKLWVGDTIKISFVLSACVALYVTIGNWNNIFAFFLNGVGVIRLQLYSAVFVGIINVPLALFLGKYLGITGVVLSTCFCLFISSVWSPIQYWKIVNQKQKGIWAK